ncbi:MAG: hypothetical protein FJ100_14665 [Deltaproteobacteria bacterium]|nr:hypothetical protein [Deltaproteobacteria bacterium]
MSAFAHLCRECLDVPSTQCGYRHCPARLGAAAALPGPAAHNADATRAVAQSAPPHPNDALATRFGAGVAQPTTAPYAQPAPTHPQPGDALQTRWVDTSRAAPPPPAAATPAPPTNSDALSTRYVSPTTEIKR